METFAKQRGWLIANDKEQSVTFGVIKPIQFEGKWYHPWGFSVILKNATFPGITEETGPVEAEIFVRPIE